MPSIIMQFSQNSRGSTVSDDEEKSRLRSHSSESHSDQIHSSDDKDSSEEEIVEATTGESMVANTVEDLHAAQQKRLALRKERLAAEKYEAEQQREWEDEERVKEAGREVDRQYEDFENEDADILYPQSPKLDRKKGKPPADGKSKRMPDGSPPSSPAKVTHKGCPVEVSRKSKKKKSSASVAKSRGAGGKKKNAGFNSIVLGAIPERPIVPPILPKPTKKVRYL